MPARTTGVSSIERATIAPSAPRFVLHNLSGLTLAVWPGGAFAASRVGCVFPFRFRENTEKPHVKSAHLAANREQVTDGVEHGEIRVLTELK
jgi:hypothetical protein